MLEVQITPRFLGRFDVLLSPDGRLELAQLVHDLRRRLAGRALWNINSTARGGGVAEMLQSILGYVRGAGIDTRWMVLSGTEPFFRVTKRLHHALHGSVGDGSPLGDAERDIYEQVLLDNAEAGVPAIEPNDIVALHDPQTAGLAPFFARLGAMVIWRCHVGTDRRSEEIERGWSFVRPYLMSVRAAVFSRERFIPEFLRDRSVVIPPAIDVFSPKNESLTEDAIRAILVHTGLIQGPVVNDVRTFVRADGTPGRVDHQADIIRLGRAPPWNAPLITQVSRWDPLKDPAGVMHGFVRFLKQNTSSAAELVLAGPSVHSVADDPEAAATLDEVEREWRALPHGLRSRVHLACLPMMDVEENAIIVNALQRHASIVVQKSLEEGFGLTVTEAMWKARPIVASAIGGIPDQMEDGAHGLLLKDPLDLDAFAAALQRFLDAPSFAAECGHRARQRVLEQFLVVRQLRDYWELLESLEQEQEGKPFIPPGAREGPSAFP